MVSVLCAASSPRASLFHRIANPSVGGYPFCVTGPSGAGYKTACNVIIKRFPWVVFSRNVSYLFSSRGAVTKTTPDKKGIFLRGGALFSMLISRKVIWEEGGSS